MKFLPFWTIAFVEGFSTLAVEVIAIRLAIPVVGSSVTLTGVMVGVVLLALSAGYWRGGALSARWDGSRTRTVLMRNLLIASVLYGALAFPLEAALLEKILDFGLSVSLAIAITTCLLFLAPIYLASQTVPMLAELINVDGKAGKASGKVLFFSTLGSVLGGIVTPVWLFPLAGVARTTWIVCALLAAMAALASAGHIRVSRLAAAGSAALVAVAAANLPIDRRGFLFESPYQSMRIVNEKKNGRMQRVLMLGRDRASGVYTDNSASFEYVLAAEQALKEVRADRVLVIGAAGFVFPRDASALPFVRMVDAVDVDPAVKEIAEREFLRMPLPPKVRFIGQSARYAVRRLYREGRQYGFAIVDAYMGGGIPEELVTVEFFRDMARLSDHTAVNAVVDSDLESAFARNLLASFRSTFGAVWVKDVSKSEEYLTNMLIASWPVSGSTRWNGAGSIYTDDRETADRDHIEMVW